MPNVQITQNPTIFGQGVLKALDPWSINFTGGATVTTVGADVTVNIVGTGGTVTSIATTAPITGGPITTTGTIGITKATTSTDGYLSAADWNTFNSKQPAGSYITALTGDGTASGPGSVAFTLATVNSNVGSFGDATHVGAFTVNGKGLITAASSVLITGTTPGGAAGGELSGTYPNPSLVNSAVIGKVLTGYVSAPGTISATDTILTAIDKLNGNTAALVTGVSSVTAANTTLTVSPNTGAVIAGINLANSNVWTPNGALSAPGATYSGTWITGGTATTNKPYFLIEPNGTTSTGWSTNGTGIGVNAATGFTGRLLDLQLAGTTKFLVNSAGTFTAQGNGTVNGSFTTNTPLTIDDTTNSISITSTGTFSNNPSGATWTFTTGNSRSFLISGGSTAQTNFVNRFTGTTYTNTSGTTGGLQISTTYNQATGTAANTDLLVRRTETALGSGAQLLADFGITGSSKWKVDNTGITTQAGTLNLRAGTATAGTAPIVFTSGTNLTVAIAGAMEYDGTQLYFSPSTTRQALIQDNGTRLTSGRVPFAGTSGYLQDDSDMTFATDTLTVTKIVGSTSVTTPLLVSTGTVRLKGYTVATLPAGTIGDTAYVTDALAPAFLTIIVGGGTVVTPVFYNGTNWIGY